MPRLALLPAWSLLASLCLTFTLVTPVAALDEGERVAAPKVLPGTIAGAWTRLRGPDSENIAYIHAAADKFNLNPAVLAGVVLTDVVSHQRSWEAWAIATPEVRSEGTLVHISPATALQDGLIRADLVLPRARQIFEAKRNDITYLINPQPGVDHWYQSCLEAATALMQDDAVAIGVVARSLRRTADNVHRWSGSLQESYARVDESAVQRRLSQAQAWPEGASFDWMRLQPGRSPWTVPTFAWTYARYRNKAFDGEPHDELMTLAAQVYQWMHADPSVVAALELPADAPEIVVYTDPAEDYSYQ